MDLLLEPLAWLLVILVSVLGVIGNLALYSVGKRGYDAVRDRFPQIKRERWERVATLYERHGSLALLLSGVPVLGSLLTTAAGAFGVRLPVFVLFVFIAKCVRNWLILVIPRELYLLFTR